ncbi:MAG: TonB-dependent receptor [Alteromonas sp. Nap_26]|nr:MAG: TonB-dependent receptor [Alteromonas sp. Nap_26]
MNKLSACSLIIFSTSAFGHGVNIEEIEVVGHKKRLIGEAIAASSGIIGQKEISVRPLLRSGEVLELVPGMVVTQHSGSGKANQYFLRGFNLDHGTDFSTSVNGMPVNMRTHGHGQGYSDLNFIIPELVHYIAYDKGAYSALKGDFSTAGSAEFFMSAALPNDMISLELGENSFSRAVAAKTLKNQSSTLLIGGELNTYDGPWTDIDEDIEKVNGLINYSTKTASGNIAITAMAYDNSWNAADQIPQRAVQNQLISSLGSLDTSVGGESNRYSISTNITHNDWYFNAYIINSDLNLFSNFTYFLEDPVIGDQFEQVDDRNIYGGEAGYHFGQIVNGMDWLHQVGMQIRMDDIKDVGLHRTKDRVRLSTVRQDEVKEQSLAIYYQSEILLTSRATLRVGARYDYLNVDVNSDLTANSGQKDDGILSLSTGLSYIFSTRWEGYFNAGQSFHSNDARGATLSIDPASGETAEPVDLLVRGNTAEMGLRYFYGKALNVSASLWWLELDSELLFVGDAGNSEASRASERYGAEVAAYYWLNEALSVDLEAALTHSRFKGHEEGEGNRIDGALGEVLSARLTWQIAPNVDTSIRLRHFGPRVLDSYGENESSSLTVINAQINWQRSNWMLTLQALNVFDSNDHDIDYLYESQLANELQPVEDVHFHPIEPRTFRAKVRYNF